MSGEVLNKVVASIWSKIVSKEWIMNVAMVKIIQQLNSLLFIVETIEWQYTSTKSHIVVMGLEKKLPIHLFEDLYQPMIKNDRPGDDGTLRSV